MVQYQCRYGVKLSVCKAGLKNNYFINDNSICIPLFGKEGSGEFFKEIIRKIPLFQRGRLERRTCAKG